jgi:restriction system protein
MEQIEGAIAVLRATVRQDLLDRLREEAPDFLEQAVLKVLHAMGYGASTDDLEHLGGAGDEGVDGLIRQDKLGLEQIYVQAKRYAADNTIGRPHLQQFVGALAGKSASRGVFITTSSFSKEARLFAHGLQNQKVILLDGEEFADLMIDYEVGVGVRHVIKTYEVDANFFEAE